jgi:Rrf2 family transcriptional regulator, cysteine metabolism repressor
MQFSTRGEYSLRAAVNLARCYPLKKSLKKIAQEERISLKYLERLFSEMKNGGIVKSLKGKNGGYYLAQNPKEIKVGKVIECTEGPIMIKCYGTKCKMIEKCPSSLVWIKLGTQIRKTLDGIKLSDIIK